MMSVSIPASCPGIVTESMRVVEGRIEAACPDVIAIA